MFLNFFKNIENNSKKNTIPFPKPHNLIEKKKKRHKEIITKISSQCGNKLDKLSLVL